MSDFASHIDHELLTRYLADECSAAEKQEVEAWMAASSQNQKAFDDWKELWEIADAPPSPKVGEPSPAAKAAFQKVKGRLGGPEVKMKKTSGKVWLNIAAGFVLLFGAFFIVRMLSNADPEMQTLTSENTTIEQVLSDGSVITLNKNSQLEFPADFTGNTREVTLLGEAFFDIERDEEHPFIIHLPESDVEVLGTSFNIQAYPDSGEIIVSVATGKVRLAAKKRPSDNVTLIAGEAGSFDPVSEKTAKEKAMDPSAMYWNDHTLVFEETPLEGVFDLLQKLYNQPIEVSNPEINNCTLTATFKDDQLETILNIIAKTFKLRVEQIGEGYLLSGNGCK